MDYEKKYKEALERARQIHSEHKAQCFDVMAKVFPELAESKDERIRQWLIRTLKSLNNSPVQIDGAYEMMLPAIDWLEKQGEQKPQRMVSAEAKEAMYNKPAWSEEDEDNFKHLMDEIVCLGNSKNSANRLYYDKLIKFLDELKNRAQPREEWRDKDERMLDRLIAYFEKRVTFTDEDNPRYANWLKNLKERYTWKPSDEQMECLSEAIQEAEMTHSEGLSQCLRSLFEQLKKLREE